MLPLLFISQKTTTTTYFSFLYSWFLSGWSFIYFFPYDLSSIDYNKFCIFVSFFLLHIIFILWCKETLSFHRYVFFNVSDVFMVIFSISDLLSTNLRQKKTDIIYYIICKIIFKSAFCFLFSQSVEFKITYQVKCYFYWNSLLETFLFFFCYFFIFIDLKFIFFCCSTEN